MTVLIAGIYFFIIVIIISLIFRFLGFALMKIDAFVKKTFLSSKRKD